MKRCRSLAAEVQNVLQDTALNWLLTSISQYAFCSTPTRYLQAKQRSIDPVCSILPWFKKDIYIYIYISLKVQTLSHNWKVHEKVKGNMIKNILPHEKCMPNVKVSRLKQCLFSQTEEELVERTDGFNSFLMSNSYLCYWNIWSLSAADFPRMDWSVTQPCQVMDFVSFFVQGYFGRNGMKGLTFTTDKYSATLSCDLLCTLRIKRYKSCNLDCSLSKVTYFLSLSLSSSLFSNYCCVILFIYISKTQRDTGWRN